MTYNIDKLVYSLEESKAFYQKIYDIQHIDYKEKYDDENGNET